MLETIEFSAGSARIESYRLDNLDSVLEITKANPELELEVQGHADSREGARAERLSEARAKAVRDHLVARGLEARRVTIVSFGATRPLASSTTALERQSNRIVRFRLLDDGKERPIRCQER